MTSNLSATNSSRSPGAASIRSADFGQQVSAEVLGDRRGQLAALLDLEPGQPLGAEILDDEGGQFVDALARIAAGRALGVDAANPRRPTAAVSWKTRNSDSPGQVGHVDQFHAETQIGGVVAETLHRLVVGHSRQAAATTPGPRISLASRAASPSITPMMSSASMNDISTSNCVNSGCRSARRSSSRKQRATCT